MQEDARNQKINSFPNFVSIMRTWIYWNELISRRWIVCSDLFTKRDTIKRNCISQSRSITFFFHLTNAMFAIDETSNVTYFVLQLSSIARMSQCPTFERERRRKMWIQLIELSSIKFEFLSSLITGIRRKMELMIFIRIWTCHKLPLNNNRDIHSRARAQ